VNQNGAKKILPPTEVSAPQPQGGDELLVVRVNAQKQPVQPPPDRHAQIGQGIALPGAGMYPPAKPAVQEDDEISTFFKNRRMIAQGSFGMHPVTKFLIFLLILTASALVSWNYVEPLRIKAQVWCVENLQISPAAYMPVWTKKAKIFKKKSLALNPLTGSETSGFLGSRGHGGGSMSRVPMDPMMQSVVFGYWPQVEAFTQARCARWQATHECAVRAWYLSYRGLKSSLRAAAMLDWSLLPVRDQIFFHYAKSVALDGPQSVASFAKALELAARDEAAMSMISDARLKYLIRSARPAAVQEYFQQMPARGVSEAERSKWRALGYIASGTFDKLSAEGKNQSVKALSQALQKFPGVFKSDPLAFAKIAPVALTLGVVKPVIAIAGSGFSDAAKLPMDPGLRRETAVILARALMLDGQLAQASERLKTAQKLDGPDAATNHFLGALALESRSSSRMREASGYFEMALKGQDRWESLYGRLLSLIRSGQMPEAGRVAATLRGKMTKDNEMWILLALAEYKLGTAKSASDDLAKAILREQTRILSGVYEKHPWSTWAGRLYVDALTRSGQISLSQKIAAKMDDVSSKTSYLSSPEFILSPTGPFALMR
jgi:hypothetical protein